MPRVGLFLFFFAGCNLFTATVLRAENWPGWRGPRGDGTSLEQNVPVRWDASKGDGLVWKTAIPGSGHAAPIVWNDRVFVAACNEETKERLLICLDRASGKIL